MDEISELKTKVERMQRSLEAFGFTDRGGELWKPPVRNIGIIDRFLFELDRIRKIEERANNEEWLSDIIRNEISSGPTWEPWNGSKRVAAAVKKWIVEG